MIGRSLITSLMPPESRDAVAGELAAARPEAFPAPLRARADHRRRRAPARLLVGDLPAGRPGGAINHLIATGTDVTEQRRADEALRISTDRLEGILEHTTTRIAVKDRDGRYLLVNRAWRESAGVDGTGRTDAELFSADIARQARRSDAQVWETAAACSSTSARSTAGPRS